MFKTSGSYSPIGIDIGSARVKMLQLVNRKGQINVHQKCHFTIPQGTFREGKIMEPAALRKILKRAKQNHDWQGNRAVLSLENRACFMSMVKMPLLSERELEQALYLETENRFPIAANEVVFSYIPTGQKTDKGSKTRQYLLAATSKDTADTYCHLALGAGFNPSALETAPPALRRSAMQSLLSVPTGSEKLQISVNIGYSSTLILICSGPAYLFHRIINQGIVSFVQHSPDSQPEKGSAALEHLFAVGSLVDKNLLEPAAKLSRALTETITYFLENNDAACAQRSVKVSLSGGGTFIPGLGRYLQNKLKLKIYLHNPLHALETHGGRRDNNSNSYYEGLLFPVAHGLALRRWLK